MIDVTPLQLTVTQRLITVGGVCFITGFVIGFIVSKQWAADGMEDFRRKFAAIIIVAWFLSVLASIIIAGYETPIYVHGMMGAVVGYLFGADSPISALTGGKRRGGGSDGT